MNSKFIKIQTRGKSVFIFALSHGQSQVERGLNINKNTLQENLQKKSLVGRRIVY